MDTAERQRIQEAMVALARGDRSAYAPVFAALWPLLREFCRQALHDESLAEDAAQGALMKVFFRATEFRPEGDVVAWALGIAAFECRSIRNRRLRRGVHLGEQALATVPGAQLSPEDTAIRADLGAELVEVMRTLRPLDRETLERVLHPVAADPQAPAFRKRLQRALERLRTAWRQTHGHDE